MRAALADALDTRAAVVFATDATAIGAARAAPRDSGLVLLVIDAGVAALDRAMLLAAIGPLAVEFAPTTRIAALDHAEGAAMADVVAGADYLASAHSTTGQALRITARG